MSVYTYQTMLLRKFYKFIKFKTVSKMFAANSPYVGPDSTRRAKFECGFQHWTIMSSNLTKSQSHNALASLVHAMVKKQCYSLFYVYIGRGVMFCLPDITDTS